MENKMKRVKIGMEIAGGATLSTVMAFIFFKNTTVCNVFLYITVCGSIVSYLVGGGIRFGVKAIWRCAKLFKDLCPFYGIDIMLAMVGLCFGIGIFSMLPIIFVCMNYMELKKQKEKRKP